MKKSEIEIGAVYIAKVSGKLAYVRIIGDSPYGGWCGRNLQTGCSVRIKTAARLRSEVKPPGDGKYEFRYSSRTARGTRCD